MDSTNDADPNNGAADAAVAAVAAASPAVTSAQQQQLVLSAEDAAQLLAQAGIQLGDNEQVIIGDIGAGGGAGAEEAIAAADPADGLRQVISAAPTGAQVAQNVPGEALVEQASEQILGTAGAPGLDDGAVLYIDPNDPQAAEILQQAGLRLTQDGTVTSLASVIDSKEAIATSGGTILQGQTLDMPTIDAPISSAPTGFVSSELSAPLMATEERESPVPHPRIPSIPRLPPTRAPPIPAANSPQTNTKSPRASKNKTPSPSKQVNNKNVLQMTPDQQQVLYSVTGEDGKTQQYMMLCPRDMDQNLLIQTLVKQVSSDPALKGGKKTIKITQQKGAAQKITGLPPGSRVVSQTSTPVAQENSGGAATTAQSTPTTTTPSGKKGSQKNTPKRQQPAVPRNLQQQVQTPTTAASGTPVTKPAGQVNNDLFNSVKPMPPSSVKNVVDATECFESVMPELALDAPIIGGDAPTRVYVRCNYCPSFRSTLNGDTWEAILNHILPVAKEEIQTSFYGDLGKHFIRSLRLQVNGRQLVRKAPGIEVPQCEVILTHSLICRKTKREFIVSNPDANFVASLAKHIRTNQPGNSGRGNSLLCIFCNSPFTHEDYLRHIQPHLDAILATLNCYAGAYCAALYETTIRAARNCNICQEPESADLRFLPCTKFSADYNCIKKLQFAVDCFREHYGDSGFLRLNTSTVARCSVCKNTQQVYCAVFHISTRMLAANEEDQEQEVNTQLAVCINCQKQFINIVMKEQGFDERLKLFQLKNMEQLCSVLRVILNQATALCEQKKTVIYTVHENSSNPSSAVHLVRSAEVTQFHPVTRLLFLAESEVSSSVTKAFFVCDLCLFSVDLTSLVATDKEKQKNDMLLAIVLEHLVPHTESLMNVIASNAANQTFSLKYEILCRVQDNKDNKSKKLVLSLQKKFKSQHSHIEIPIDKDEDKTMSQLRAGVKADRKNYIALRNAKGQTIGDANAAGQLIEVNKYIEKQKGKLGILAQTGCNTTLLNFYTECKLCSKFSFPDFRLCAGAYAAAAGTSANPKAIDLCENCVETVLTLCLPTEPETLQEPEECLALGEPRAVGHRLVLSNNLKKWLSLDGVKLIKKTVDEFEDAKQHPNDCSTVFQEALKRHCIAVIKTCLRDEDITGCAAGFCITDTFLGGNRGNDDETAAALASLEQQIGMPIREKPKTPALKPNEVQVTILSRRKGRRLSNAPFGQGMTKTGPVTPATITPLRKNGATPVMGTPTGTPGVLKVTPAPVAAAAAAAAKKKVNESEENSQEESVSAIQSFLDATSGDVNNDKGNNKKTSPAKTANSTPTAAAASDNATKSSERGRRTSGRIVGTSGAVRDLSMVTLTPNGVVKKVVQRRRSNRNKDEEGVSDEEADSETQVNQEAKTTETESKKSPKKREDTDFEPPSKKPHLEESPSPEKSQKGGGGGSGEDTTPGSRTRRNRKEKKIFDL